MERLVLAKEKLEQVRDMYGEDLELFNHPSFRYAFISAFVQVIGLVDNVEIIMEDGALILRTKNDYPNATNGIFKGVKDAKKCVLKLENIFEQQYLMFKFEDSSICCFPENQFDNLSYHTGVTAYKGGYEVGFANFLSSENVMKHDIPERQIYDKNSLGTGNKNHPELGIRDALSDGMFIIPSGAKDFEWTASSGCRLSDGVAFVSRVRNKDAQTRIERNAYCHVGAEHPERLAGNISVEFLTQESEKSPGERYYHMGAWKDGYGNEIPGNEISKIVVEHCEMDAERGHSRG